MYGLLCSEEKSGLRKSLLLEKVKLSAKQELFIKRESELLGQSFGAFKGSLSRNMLIIKACGSREECLLGRVGSFTNTYKRKVNCRKHRLLGSEATSSLQRMDYLLKKT